MRPSDYCGTLKLPRGAATRTPSRLPIALLLRQMPRCGSPAACPQLVTGEAGSGVTLGVGTTPGPAFSSRRWGYEAGNQVDNNRVLDLLGTARSVSTEHTGPAQPWLERAGGRPALQGSAVGAVSACLGRG